MNQMFRLSGSVKRDPAINAWLDEHPGELGAIARHWFDVIRGRGDDVRELLHDGTGRYMRHVKIGPDGHLDDEALTELIESAYTDMKRRLEAPGVT